MGHPAQISLSERLRSVEADIAAGRAENALARCQEIAAQYPRALAVQRVLGEIYLALRKPREALAALDRALAGDPEDARACCARAIVHQMHGDTLAALAWYRRACDIRFDDQALRATYREMATSLGQPPYHPTRVGLARLYLRGDLFALAIREWETLIAENGDLLEAQVGLVETLWRADRAQDARDWARRVLTNAPWCVKPMLVVAVIAHDEGNAAEAERLVQRAGELDPDQRIAQALFTDRIATGDSALINLLWRDKQPFDASSSGGMNPAAPWARAIQGTAPTQPQSAAPTERRVNRPLVTSAPTPETQAMEAPPSGARVTRAPITGAPITGAPITGAPITGVGGAVSRPLPPPTRPANLPQGFHNMFKETEGMLWRPEDSDPNAGVLGPNIPPVSAGPSLPLPQTPPQQPSSGPDPSMLDTSVTPALPALAEGGFAAGDTETRRAIRFVQWLQAQGARARGNGLLSRGRPTGSLDALLNAPPTPQTPNASQEPQRAVPTQPFSAPSPEDLRQMFAELEPSAGGRGAADADAAASSQGIFDGLASTPPDVAPASHTELAEAAPEVVPEAPLEATSGATSGELTWERVGSAEEAPPQTTAAHEPDVTLEDLERQRSAEGFAPFPLEQGTLAALGTSEADSQEAQTWLDASAEEAPQTATTHEPDVTLEDLERLRSAEGFAPFPLEHGALAALGTSEAGSQEPQTWLDVSAKDTGAAAGDVEDAQEPELALPARQQDAPDPHDYPARLAHARRQRDSGEMDNAIVEYRAVLRNSPELLPEVLGDVEACLEERPEHPELHRLLGDARIRQGDYLSALESYNRAVALTQSLEG